MYPGHGEIKREVSQVLEAYPKHHMLIVKPFALCASNKELQHKDGVFNTCNKQKVKKENNARPSKVRM